MLNPLALFGIGNTGRSVNVSAQDRTNLYVEVNQDAEKHVLTMYPTPGKVVFVNFGSYVIRGAHQLGDYMYVVNRNKLWRISNDATTLELGTLNSAGGRVDIADNGTQIIIVDGPDGYIYNVNTTVFAEITDVDFPGGTTVTFINGRFLVSKPNSGEFYWSSLYDGLAWDALDFATAESDPDNLVRVFAEGGQVVMFGEKTSEFWGDSGGVDAAFSRIQGGAIEWGLAARWSLAKFMDSLIFLRKNRLGQTQVCVMSGSTSVPVSNTQVDQQIGSYGDVSDATGLSYMINGHPFYQINFPSANVSWLYDGQSKAWSKLTSSAGRDKAEIAVQLLGNIYATASDSGKLYLLDPDVFTSDGEMIEREFVSRHQSTGDYLHMPEMWLEMESGVGLQTGQGSDPQIMLQISKDGGKTYGNELWRSFGAVGKYLTRARWTNLGRARDWIFKFRVTDPVKTVFVAAWGRVTK